MLFSVFKIFLYIYTKDWTKSKETHLIGWWCRPTWNVGQLVSGVSYCYLFILTLFFRCCFKVSKIATIFTIVVLCSVSRWTHPIIVLLHPTLTVYHTVKYTYLLCIFILFFSASLGATGWIDRLIHWMYNMLNVSCFQLFFSMYPDRDNPWRMLAVSSTDSFCILAALFLVYICISGYVMKLIKKKVLQEEQQVFTQHSEDQQDHKHYKSILRYKGRGKSMVLFTKIFFSAVSISTFSLDCLCPSAMNLTDFRDNALLKLQVGGPFAGGMIDLNTQEYILIQVEQTEPGQRRRRTQQVRTSVCAPLPNHVCSVSR